MILDGPADDTSAMALDLDVVVSWIIGVGGILVALFGVALADRVLAPKLEFRKIHATEMKASNNVAEGELLVDAFVTIRNVGRSTATRVCLVGEASGAFDLTRCAFQGDPITLAPNEEREFHAYASMMLPLERPGDLRSPFVDPRSLSRAIAFWAIADRGAARAIVVRPTGVGSRAGDLHYEHVPLSAWRTRKVRARVRGALRAERALPPGPLYAAMALRAQKLPR